MAEPSGGAEGGRMCENVLSGPVRAPDRETGFFGTEVSEPGRASGPPGGERVLRRNEHLSNDIVLESFYAS